MPKYTITASQGFYVSAEDPETAYTHAKAALKLFRVIKITNPNGIVSIEQLAALAAASQATQRKEFFSRAARSN